MDVSLVFKIIVVMLAIVVGIASYFYGPFKGHFDNPIEEAAEEVIKEETGVNIDLTPFTKEHDANDKK